jgi:hypothetical protein
MLLVDALASVRAALGSGQTESGLEYLDQLRSVARESNQVADLQAVLEVARKAEYTLKGSDKKRAYHVRYATEQDLRDLELELGASSQLVSPGATLATVGDSAAVVGAQAAVAPATGMHVVEAKGLNGTVRLESDFLTISRKGFMARASVGKGEKRILLNQLTAVQLKPAGPVINGFIQFTVGGGNESRSRFGSQTRNAAEDENSVIFTWAKRVEFEALRDAVERAMADRHRPQQHAAPATPSIPEQITQLAGLRDAGILSDQEFETKKQELLARM